MARRIGLVPAISLLIALAAVLGPQRALGAGKTDLTLGEVRTALGDRALRIAVEKLTQWNGTDFQMNGERSLFYVTPEVQIITGDEDAFSGLTTKLVGSFLRFGTTTVAGHETPDTRFFWSFPVSIGVEGDRAFENVATLAEIGVSPWFQGAAPRVFKSAFVGAFIQGGYKYARDDSSRAEGGAADESEEKADDGIARFKGTARWTPPTLFKRSGVFEGLDLKASADYWRDLKHSANYYRVVAKFVFHLDKEKTLDWTYEKGAGAPTFNKGEQFSANLTVSF